MAFFDDTVYQSRRERVAEAVAAAGRGGLVLGTGPEFEYLTGSPAHSHERLTALVFAADGAAAVIAPATDVGVLRAWASLGSTSLSTWRDGEDPYRLVAQHLGTPGPAQVGGGLAAAHVFRLRDAVGEVGPVSEEVLECFMAKDPAEIAELARAAAAIDRVHAKVPELLVPGATEAAVAAELEKLILAEHRSVDFVIVGSGENGANPHHSFSDRVLTAGDPVVVDLGGTLDSGYHSDCTRTHVVGGADAAAGDFRECYEAVRRAHLAALEAARPGMAAGELDAVARGVIEAAGLGEHFTHRLGHGIGLAGHEAPFIIGGSGVTLRENMAFSIEPGVYLPDQWGVRIEDIVVLSADGARPLNRQPREL